MVCKHWDSIHGKEVLLSSPCFIAFFFQWLTYLIMFNIPDHG